MPKLPVILMNYCLNSRCSNPNNPAETNFCRSCGTKLLLKDRYRAIKPLGQGGFGKTFLAVDEDKPSKPRCVIKQFFPQAQGTNTVQKAAQLFELEAVRLDQLGKHPQIPELLAYFIQDDQQYLVQEFIDGQDLNQELASGNTFNENQIRSLLNDLLPVLQFVHQQQVIHRDLKPDNIIRRQSDQRLFIVDFGAAKVVTGTALAQTGTTIGSAGYVAPEQAMGRANYASDIYSLGVTCIHLLTGLHPFDSYDANEGTWVWQDYLKTPVSKNFCCILDKMLESATNRRYQSAAEVIKDISTQTSTSRATAQPKSNIARELEELSSEFLGSAKEQQKFQPSNSATPKSEIDWELEEIKSEFLGFTKQKNNSKI